MRSCVMRMLHVPAAARAKTDRVAAATTKEKKSRKKIASRRRRRRKKEAAFRTPRADVSRLYSSPLIQYLCMA